MPRDLNVPTMNAESIQYSFLFDMNRIAQSDSLLLACDEMNSIYTQFEDHCLVVVWFTHMYM